jgi:hypothetical protein
MLLVREVFHCKPGKVRTLVEKFQAMAKLGEKSGMPKMRILTDLSGAKYWTLVAEMEVESLAAFEKLMSPESMSEQDAKQYEEIMKGYHDLVVDGRREFYTIEG